MSHFIIFLVFAFFLWYQKSPLFKAFTYTIVLVSYLGFLTFIVFPAMPPWKASLNGLIPRVTQISFLTTPKFTTPGTLPTIYKLFRANDVAAIPSLHAAYPVVIFLFSLLLRRMVLIFLATFYLLSVWLAVVYLGEHYVVDVLAGLIYALVSYLVIKKLFPTRKISPAIEPQLSHP